MSLSARFVAPEYRGIEDAGDRRKRIADLIYVDIVPRLVKLHAGHRPKHPTPENIADLARLVIASDGQESTDFVEGLKDDGLSVETLFTELLQPTAQRLGELWDEDRVDFIDVTLGVGRLQALLSQFNCTHEIAPSGHLRSVLMLTVPGEQHGFGIAMVERFLSAGGWSVSSEQEVAPHSLAKIVKATWFAVAGVTLSQRRNLDEAARIVRVLRTQAVNQEIGIMVGGPVFNGEPQLAQFIGADGTASSAPGAVLLAQKLLDQAISRGGRQLLYGGGKPR